MLKYKLNARIALPANALQNDQQGNTGEPVKAIRNDSAESMNG